MNQDMKEGKIRALAVSLMSAAAVAAGLLLIRQQRHEDLEPNPENMVPAGETVPGAISLERLRELGI
jgi:hypothetical protein